MFSIDWAVKKKFQIYNVAKKKLKSISPTREAYDKFFDKLKDTHSFYIEEGGRHENEDYQGDRVRICYLLFTIDY